MTRLLRFALSLALISTAAASAADLPSARARCLAQGGDCTVAAPAAPDVLVYNLIWENGPFDGNDGLASIRNGFVSGTGGPEGDHGSTVADDFQVPANAGPLEFQICIQASGIVLAEMYVWTNTGGSPTLPVTTPILGGPTTASIVSTTYARNTPYCPDAFGDEGRLYLFNEATTGVALALPAGTYWLGAVGEGTGPSSLAYFATSTPATPLASGVWGSTAFAAPYWTPVSDFGGYWHDFAFRVVSAQDVPLQAIPALGARGLALLAALLVAAALVVLRLRR